MKHPELSIQKRITEIADELDKLPRSQIAARLEQMRTEGEDPSVLSYFRLGSQVPSTPDLEPGDQINNKYIVERKIGEGGMGVVFHARQTLVADRIVALKLIHPFLVSPGMIRRFRTEIGLLGQLDHPGIVGVYDADVYHCRKTNREIPFFVMSLIEGRNIKNWVFDRQLGLEDIVDLVASVCDAVQHAHDRGIAHRDLKPENILVKSNGHPVVLDFGLARSLQNQSSEYGHSSEGTGEWEMPSGTLPYLSPEQFRAKRNDFGYAQSADVYSLGVILFELLTGTYPYRFSSDMSTAETRREVLLEPPRGLRLERPDATKQLADAIAKALNKNPAERFYSVSSFAAALRRAHEDSATHQRTPGWQARSGAIVPSTEWRIERKLGEGSVGEVWLAQHRRLQQSRVFKFCKQEEKVRSLNRELTLFKFLKEKVGQNNCFVRLHGVSLDSAPYYLMMEFIDGWDLRTWHESRLQGESQETMKAGLELIAQAADAAQVAHDVGVLHRDLKPSNLLIEPDKEASCGYRLYISDFGIGHLISDEFLFSGASKGFTQTLFSNDLGFPQGSLVYMAPEIIAGGEASTRSDIYALGVVLYQLLVGDFTKPLASDWKGDIEDELVREDLEQCVAGDPKERFGNAGELAARLRKLDQRRSEARRLREDTSRKERAAYRRGALRAAAATALGLLIVFGSSVFSWQMKQNANRASELADRNLGGELLQKATANLLEKQVGRRSQGLATIASATNLFFDNHQAFRETAIALFALGDISLAPQLIPSSATDLVVALCPNTSRRCRITSEGSLTVDDFPNRASSNAIELPANLTPNTRKLKISETGNLLALTTQANRVSLWKLPNLEKLGDVPGTVYHDVVTFNADASIVALGRADGSMEGYRTDTLDRAWILRSEGTQEAHDSVAEYSHPIFQPISRPPNAAAFSRDGTMLAIASAASLHIIVWNIPSGQVLCYPFHAAPPSAVAWSNHDRTLYVACEDGLIYSWDIASINGPILDKPTETFQEVRTPILALTSDNAGQWLASLDAKGSVTVRELASGESYKTVAPTESSELALSTEGTQLIIQSGRAPLLGIKLTPGDCFAEVRMATTPNDLTFSRTNNQLIVATEESVTTLDPLTPLQSESFPTSMTHALKVDPRTGDLFSAGRLGPRIWNSSSNETLTGSSELGPDRARGPGPIGVGWINDHRILAAAVGDRIEIIDPDNGETMGQITAHGTIQDLTFHPTGGWLAFSCAASPHLIIAYLESDHLNNVKQHVVQWPQKPPRRIHSAFDPDGEHLIARVPGSFIRWKVDHWDSPIEFAQYELGAPAPFSFDGSGEIIATVYAETRIRLIDYETGLGFATLQAPNESPISELAVSSDGKWVAALMGGRRVQIWNLIRVNNRLARFGLDW